MTVINYLMQLFVTTDSHYAVTPSTQRPNTPIFVQPSYHTVDFGVDSNKRFSISYFFLKVWIVLSVDLTDSKPVYKLQRRM